MHVVDIAHVCHEANRVLQLINDEEPSPRWNDAPQWQTESAIDGVAKAIAGATPEHLHESWVQFKLNDNWSYGPVKDETTKTHPCLVEYDALPAAQRAKDAVFQAIVAALWRS